MMTPIPSPHDPALRGRIGCQRCADHLQGYEDAGHRGRERAAGPHGDRSSPADATHVQVTSVMRNLMRRGQHLTVNFTREGRHLTVISHKRCYSTASWL